jgi:hypothetical protein
MVSHRIQLIVEDVDNKKVYLCDSVSGEDLSIMLELVPNVILDCCKIHKVHGNIRVEAKLFYRMRLIETKYYYFHSIVNTDYASLHEKWREYIGY